MEGEQGFRQRTEAYLDEEDYLRRPREYFKRLAGLIRQRGGEGLSLIDVGCASGGLLRYLRGIFPSFRLYGLDQSRELVERARRLILNDLNQVQHMKFLEIELGP